MAQDTVTGTRRGALQQTREQRTTLARDIELTTPEIYKPNDYYGHATHMKRRLGIAPKHPLKAALAHGPSMIRYIWPNDYRNELPLYLCHTRRFAEEYMRQGGKPAFPVGPPLGFIPGALDPVPPPPGPKSLLYFPAHSTHWLKVQNRFDEEARLLESVSFGFDRIVVSVYWKDILLGNDLEYEKRGLECVTAGHMYDPDFLPRWLEMVRASHGAVVSYGGSALPYTVLLGRPVWAPEITLPLEAEAVDNAQGKQWDAIRRSGWDLRKEMFRLFREPHFELTEEQRAFIHEHTGMHFRRSDDELREILQAAEEQYARRHGGPANPELPRIQRPGSGNGDVRTLLTGIMGAISENRYDRAIELGTEALTGGLEMPGLRLLRGIALSRAGDIEGALRAVDEELERYPDNADARLYKEQVLAGAAANAASSAAAGPAKPATAESPGDGFPPAVYITTYPRSGTTWMLRALMRLFGGQEAEVASDKYTDHVVPNERGVPIGFLEAPDAARPVIVKSHKTAPEMVELAEKRPVIYLLRDGRDALTSYYFFKQTRVWKRPKDEVRFDPEEFARHLEEEAGRWADHVRRSLDTPGALFFAYEEMKRDFRSVLEQVVATVDLEPVVPLDDVVREFVDDFKPNGDFFRKGVVGDWQNYWDQRHLEIFQRRAGDLLERLGYADEHGDTERRMDQAREALARSDHATARKLVFDLKAELGHYPGLDALRGDIFAAQNQIEAARESYREELRWYPDNREAKAGLERMLQHEKGLTIVVDDEFRQLYDQVKPYTMLTEKRLFAIYSLAKQICQADVPGNFVECGVAAGGTTAILAHVAKHHSRRARKVYAFDTYEGMPAPSEHDVTVRNGVTAEDSGWGEGTCAAPIESVREICRIVGAEELLVPVAGLFDETLPDARGEIGAIALLHADSDWYESQKTIFDNLYDQLSPGGVVQVDDYGFWSGSRKAIDEFLRTRGVKVRIEPIDGNAVWFTVPRT